MSGVCVSISDHGKNVSPTAVVVDEWGSKLVALGSRTTISAKSAADCSTTSGLYVNDWERNACLLFGPLHGPTRDTRSECFAML